jgi:hypothetical protein
MRSNRAIFLGFCPDVSVHSPAHVDIPEVVTRYRLGADEEWKAAQGPWQRSRFKDYSVWGEYAELAKEGRIWIPRTDANAAYKFVEYHAALMLKRQGYRYWGGVQLFDYHLLRNGKGPARPNTEEVRRLSIDSWPWPSDIQKELRFRPKNPDLVAYHPERRKWLFLEVKKDDSCHPDQVKALAVLHLLTGALAAVIRVLPAGRFRKLHSYKALIEYGKGASLKWIRPTRGARRSMSQSV